MATDRDITDLENPELVEFQRKSWKVQRAGWVALLLILIAGALGLFGGIGPLASAAAGDESSPIRVDYKRFVQFLEPTRFQISVQPQDSSGDTIRLWISRDYLNQFMLQQITPEPDSQEAESGRVIYEFKVTEAGEPFQVTFDIRHSKAGVLNAEIGLDGGETLNFTQLVYP